MAPLSKLWNGFLFQTGFLIMVLYGMLNLARRDQLTLEKNLDNEFIHYFIAAIIIGGGVASYMFNLGDITSPLLKP